MNKRINNAIPVTLEELRRNIPITGADATPVIISEPGCGKSSLILTLQKDLGDRYDYIYVDCPVKLIEDIGMNIPNHKTLSLEYYVAGLFKMDSPKPKIIMLDEYMKSPKLLQIIFTRLMLEHMVGDRPLPRGSIVFATSNNESDGVGDSMLAHSGNRVTIFYMKKPGHLEWLPWASENKISRILRAWVALNPRCLASYLDGGQDSNPFIFNPVKPTLSFVSPRSLAKSDIYIREIDRIGHNFAMAGLAGTLGVSAAESISSFLRLEAELVPVRDIIDGPTIVPMPENMGAVFLTLFNATDEIQTQDELSSFIKFVKRVKHSEAQSVFFSILYSNSRTTAIAKNNADVMEWYKENYMLMSSLKFIT